MFYSFIVVIRKMGWGLKEINLIKRVRDYGDNQLEVMKIKVYIHRLS